MKTVPPRTKITLTIAGLLSLAGIFYAANPTPFATVNTPIGVAASTTDLIVTEYCGHNVDTIDCQGNVTLLATLPGIVNCREEYVTIAPAQSVNAGFTPRDIFVTQGPGIYKVTGGIVTPFALMPDCAEDHTGAGRGEAVAQTTPEATVEPPPSGRVLDRILINKMIS